MILPVSTAGSLHKSMGESVLPCPSEQVVVSVPLLVDISDAEKGSSDFLANRVLISTDCTVCGGKGTAETIVLDDCFLSFDL